MRSRGTHNGHCAIIPFRDHADVAGFWHVCVCRDDYLLLGRLAVRFSFFCARSAGAINLSDKPTVRRSRLTWFAVLEKEYGRWGEGLKLVLGFRCVAIKWTKVGMRFPFRIVFLHLHWERA